PRRLGRLRLLRGGRRLLGGRWRGAAPGPEPGDEPLDVPEGRGDPPRKRPERGLEPLLSRFELGVHLDDPGRQLLVLRPRPRELAGDPRSLGGGRLRLLGFSPRNPFDRVYPGLKILYVPVCKFLLKLGVAILGLHLLLEVAG